LVLPIDGPTDRAFHPRRAKSVVGLVAIPRVEFRVVIDEAIWFDRGVDLGRRNARVPEHLLDGAQIGATGEQMRCERVSQRMWLHFLGDPGTFGVVLDDQPQTHTRERTAALVEKELAASARL